ncbi:hypothetical protein FKM82_019503 [Ascaphus truei]
MTCVVLVKETWPCGDSMTCVVFAVTTSCNDLSCVVVLEVICTAVTWSFRDPVSSVLSAILTQAGIDLMTCMVLTVTSSGNVPMSWVVIWTSLITPMASGLMCVVLRDVTSSGTDRIT